MKIVENIQPKIVIFTDVKNRCMLHFVMLKSDQKVYCSLP